MTVLIDVARGNDDKVFPCNQRSLGGASNMGSPCCAENVNMSSYAFFISIFPVDLAENSKRCLVPRDRGEGGEEVGATAFSPENLKVGEILLKVKLV